MDKLNRDLIAACRQYDDVSNHTDTTKLIRRRLRLLEPGKALENVSIRVNFDRLGFQTVIFWLTVDIDVIDECLERLQTQAPFTVVYEVSGSPNVFAVGRFSHELALATSLKDLLRDPDVRSVSINHVDEVVEEGKPIDRPTKFGVAQVGDD